MNIVEAFKTSLKTYINSFSCNTECLPMYYIGQSFEMLKRKHQMKALKWNIIQERI